MFLIDQPGVLLVGWPAPGLLLLIRRDGVLAFHDTASRAAPATFGAPRKYVDPIRSFSGDGRWLVAHRAVWDLAPLASAHSAGLPLPAPAEAYTDAGHKFLISCLYAVSVDGRRAVRTVGEDIRFDRSEIVEVPGFAVLGLCPGAERLGPSYAAALTGRFVVWYRERFPPYRNALVHSLETGAWVSTLPHTQGINAVAFSPEGRLLATAAVGTVRVWAPESGECVRKFKAVRGTVTALAWHPSGRFLGVCCPDGSVRFWDVGGGKELAAFDWGAGVTGHLAFSPDGSMAAAGTADKVVVWDVDV